MPASAASSLAWVGGVQQADQPGPGDLTAGARPAGAQRLLVLRATEALISDRGVAAVTLGAVARAVELEEAAVRWHFPSVDKLLRGYLHALREQEQRQVRPGPELLLRARSGPARTEAVPLLTAYLQRAAQGASAVVAVRLHAAATAYPVIAAHLEQQQLRRTEGVAALVAATFRRPPEDRLVLEAAADLALLLDSAVLLRVYATRRDLGPWLRACCRGLLEPLLAAASRPDAVRPAADGRVG